MSILHRAICAFLVAGTLWGSTGCERSITTDESFSEVSIVGDVRSTTGTPVLAEIDLTVRFRESGAVLGPVELGTTGTDGTFAERFQRPVRVGAEVLLTLRATPESNRFSGAEVQVPARFEAAGKATPVRVQLIVEGR